MAKINLPNQHQTRYTTCIHVSDVFTFQIKVEKYFEALRNRDESVVILRYRRSLKKVSQLKLSFECNFTIPEFSLSQKTVC